jgi:hypothetical protein
MARIPPNNGNGGKSRRGGPLIAGKASEMFPSLERSVKNQSELSLLKLPEIASGPGGSLKKVSGRQSNDTA